MATLHVEFQEGWSGDDVIVRIGGLERRLAALQTRTQIGLAGDLVEEVADGPVQVEVAVPGRGQAGHYAVTVEHEHWVGVSLVDDALVFTDQAELFGYL